MPEDRLAEARRVADFVARELDNFQAAARRLPVSPTITAGEIRARLREFDFAGPRPVLELTAAVSRMMRDGTLHGAHPRYYGLFVPGVHPASVWADALAALYNPQVGAWWHAPAANEIERHALRFCARELGLGEECVGHFTSGGSEANHTALITATFARFPDAASNGLASLPPVGVYLSREAHHSFNKIARATGVGERALRVINVRDDLSMDVGQLRDRLTADRAAGRHPLMVVATLGTTTGGGMDPLGAVGALARDFGAWFHVDAAWGAGIALAPAFRSTLAGIERADSITWDAHKWLSVAMGAGMFFCRHPAMLRRAFAVHTPYLPDASGGERDLYAGSLQWSRRFIGLKVFMTLAALGREGMRAMIEHQIAMGDYLRERLRARAWRILNRTPLPVVCFTHEAIERGAVPIELVVNRTVASGRAWVSMAALGSQRVIRACISHQDTNEGDIDVLLEELQRAVAGQSAPPQDRPPG